MTKQEAQVHAQQAISGFVDCIKSGALEKVAQDIGAMNDGDITSVAAVDAAAHIAVIRELKRVMRACEP